MAEFPEGRKRTSGWLIGCLGGCLLAVLAVGGLIGAGAWYIHGLTGRFEESVEAGKQVEARFGPPEQFVPWPDGVIPPQRLEIFLAVREAMTPQREGIKAAIARLPVSESSRAELKQKHGFEKLTSIFGISRGALGLAPAIGDLFRARSQALLDRGMGMGEYEYLYVVAFGSWLKLGPGAEPVEGASPGDPFSRMGSDVSSRLRDHLLAMLRNQAKGLPPGAAEPGKALAAEIAKMETNPERIPWQEGLPPAMAASLEPFRSRLAASWSPSTAAFELAISRKENRFSYSAD